MFAALPLLVLPVAGYNLFVFLLLPGGRRAPADGALTRELISAPMASGAHWAISAGDLVVLVSLAILFIDMLKTGGSRPAVVINHSLAMLLFIACLVEFLLFRAFATSAFFLLTVMVLLDVLAGFIATLRQEMELR